MENEERESDNFVRQVLMENKQGLLAIKDAFLLFYERTIFKHLGQRLTKRS
jgi:hypothetical protein